MRHNLGTAALLFLLLTAPAWSEPIHVSGRIEPAGAPGARVELVPVSPEYDQALHLLEGRPAEPLATAKPAADGSFELIAPRPGFYTVVTGAEGFLEMRSWQVSLVEETDLATVRLPPAAALALTVLEPSGKPAAGIVVRAEAKPSSRANPAWQPVGQRAVSGADGRISLPRRPGETLVVIVVSPNFFGQWIDTAGAGEAVLRLQRAPLAGVEARDPEGRPIAGALIRWQDWPVAVTGQDGKVTLAAPADGGAFQLEAADGKTADITLLPGQSPSPLRVTLHPPEILSGRVVDARMRGPIPGALVWSDTTGTISAARTEADGSFRLTMPPGGQERMLMAAAPGYVRTSWFNPMEGQTFGLQPSAPLAGRVVDAEGRPVASALVRALPVTTPGHSELFPWVEGRTHPDGTFHLRGLAAGASWRLRATAQGYAPGEQMAATGEPGRSGPPVRIVLDAGITLTGRLVDPEGRPVPGAEVVLRPPADRALDVQMSDEELRATSEADGRFRFAHLGAGRRDLSIQGPGFAPFRQTDLQIAARPSSLDLGDLRLIPGAVIQGRVTDERGSPVAEAWVSAVSFDPLLAGTHEEARTGTDGRFRIAGLTPGRRFELMVSHPAYAPFQAPGVEPSATEPFEVVLRAARTLTGRVLDGARRPVPAQISQLESQQVSLGGSTSGSMGMGTAGRADGEGRFVLRGLTPGLLDLRFEAPGFQPRTVQGVRIPETEDPPPLEVVLEPGAVLEGRVVTRRGTPLSGAWIEARPAGPRQFGEAAFSSTTGADGSYRVDGLGPGLYEVEVHRESGSTAIRKEVSMAGGGTQRLDLTVPSGATVSGRVTNERGEPVPGVEVSLIGPGSQLRTVSGAGGAFRLNDVEAGEYGAAAVASGYAPAAAPDKVRVEGEGEIAGLELRLLPEARITGRLLGLSGEEWREVRVTAVPTDGASSSWRAFEGKVDAAALYRISSLGPGGWRVQASSPTGRQAAGTVRLSAPGEEAVLDLEFTRGLTVSGRVLLDGEPLAGADVRAIVAGPEGAAEQRQASSRYDGSFTLEGLPPGRLTLAAIARGIGQARQMELAADLEVSFDVLTGRATGHVFAADGQPLEGAVVAFQGEDPDLALSFSAPQVQTDERGAFEVPRLAAGSYRITAQAPGFGPVAQTVMVTPGGTTEVQVVLKGKTLP